MDIFTHALLGAACGYALDRARTRMSLVAGAAAALLPDLDVLIGSDSDPLVTLELHRQFTLSFVPAPMGGALLAALLWLALKQKDRFLPLFIASLAGYLSAI